MKGRESLYTELPSETKRRIRVEAAKQDRTMSDLAREALQEWVDENIGDAPLDE